MSKIKIIADSACDMPAETAHALNITVIPIPVHIGEKTYYDGVDINNAEFYHIISTAKEAASTSQITPFTFESEFRQQLAQNNEVIYISFSSGLSGIYQSALTARNNIEDKKHLHIIDSKCASGGYGLVVINAAKMAADNKTVTEIITATEHMCEHMQHVFAAGSLEMLRRGGRITAGQAFIGTALNIKPILHVVDGKIYPLEKVRTTKKMLIYLTDALSKGGRNIEAQILGISHANNPALAAELAAMIKERFNVKEIIISEIGATVGSHAGPDTIALFFQN